MATDRELFIKVETLQNMLIARACGGSMDDGDYVLLRMELLALPRLQKLLPTFVETCRSDSQFWQFIKYHDPTYAGRRTYLWNSFRQLLDDLEARQSTPVDLAAAPILSKVDSEHVREAWLKALDRRTSDPEGAITAARSLLETVCKHILDTKKLPYDDAWQLPKLYSTAAAALSLSPSQHGEQAFRQILGSCQSVVEGLAGLRNALGDAHGKGARGVRPLPRHAELAVNLAGAAATFLIATLEASRQQQGAKP
jgi:hypothetical protein